jgi:hypothetical protein
MWFAGKTIVSVSAAFFANKFCLVITGLLFLLDIIRLYLTSVFVNGAVAAGS